MAYVSINKILDELEERAAQNTSSNTSTSTGTTNTYTSPTAQGTVTVGRSDLDSLLSDLTQRAKQNDVHQTAQAALKKLAEEKGTDTTTTLPQTGTNRTATQTSLKAQAQALKTAARTGQLTDTGTGGTSRTAATTTEGQPTSMRDTQSSLLSSAAARAAANTSSSVNMRADSTSSLGKRYSTDTSVVPDQEARAQIPAAWDAVLEGQYAVENQGTTAAAEQLSAAQAAYAALTGSNSVKTSNTRLKSAMAAAAQEAADTGSSNALTDTVNQDLLHVGPNYQIQSSYTSPNFGAQSAELESNVTTTQRAAARAQQTATVLAGNLSKSESTLQTLEATMKSLYSQYTATKSQDAYAAFQEARNQWKVAQAEYNQLNQSYQQAQSEVQTTITAAAEATAAQTAYEQEQAQAAAQWRAALRSSSSTEMQRDQKAVAQWITEARDNLAELEYAAENPGAMRDEHEDLEAELAAARQRLAELESQQQALAEEGDWYDYFRYNEEVTSQDDFAEKSQYQSTANGKDVEFAGLAQQIISETGFDDVAYDYINGNEQARQVVTYQDVALDARLAGVDSSFLQQMTDTEVAVFNYLYATEGADSAYEYINFLQDNSATSLNARQREAEEGYWSSWAEEHPVKASAFSTLASPLKGLSYVAQLADYAEDMQIDQNAGYNQYSYMNSAIRDTVSDVVEDKWGSVGSFLYQTGMSMADFLYQGAITGGNEALTLAIMGTGAAADTVIEKKDQGYSDNEAFWLGTIAGAAEIVTEKISIETLLDATSLGENALGYILKNTLAEGSEEVGSDLINLFADILITRDDSQWSRSIAAYEAEGKSESEAFAAAVTDQAVAMGLDFLGGAISGGVMGSVGAGVRTAQNTSMGRTIQELGPEYTQSAIDAGLEQAEGTTARKVAEQLQTAQSANQTISNQKLGKLQRALIETYQVQQAEAKKQAQARARQEAVQTQREIQTPNTPAGELRLLTADEEATQRQAGQAGQIRTDSDTDGELRLLTAEQEETQRRLAQATTDTERTGIEAGASEESIRTASRLSSALGRQVEFYDGRTLGGAAAVANGYYTADGTIHINSRSRNVTAQIISHEATHSLQETGGYQELQSLVLQKLGQDGTLATQRQQKQDLYSRAGVNLTNQNQIDQELVAEYVEKYLLTDEQTILETAKQNRSLGQKILDAIDRVLARLGSGSAQERVFLQKARNAWATALQQTAQTTQAAPTQATANATAQTQAQNIRASQDTNTEQNVTQAATQATQTEPEWVAQYRQYRQMYENQYQAGEITEEEYRQGVEGLDQTAAELRAQEAQSAAQQTATQADTYQRAVQSIEEAYRAGEMTEDAYRTAMQSVEEILQSIQGEAATQATQTTTRATAQAEETEAAEPSEWRQSYRSQVDSIRQRYAAGQMSDAEFDRAMDELDQQAEFYGEGSALEPAWYSIGTTTGNEPFVEVEEDILAGVPQEDWVRTVKDNLREKFPNGITVGNSEIVIDGTSRREMTYSRYMQWLYNNNQTAYADKMRATNNADEILRATTDWTNEGLNHPRRDKIRDFARGSVLMQVGGNQYSADVVVGTRDNGEMVLYDILNLQPTSFTERETDAAIRADPSPGISRSTASISNNSVADNGIPVKTQFSISEPVEQTRDLIALHNLNEDKLRSTLELGGFPMPSIAILQEQMEHDGFGDITMLFGRETIDPQADSRNRVYGGDAWTPTSPEVHYEVNGAAAQAFDRRIAELSGQIAGGIFRRSNAVRSIVDETSNMGVEQLADRLADRDEIKAAYLADQGQTVEPVYKKKEYSEFGNDVARQVAEQVGPDRLAEINLAFSAGEWLDAAAGDDAQTVRQIIQDAYEQRQAAFFEKYPERREARTARYMENHATDVKIMRLLEDAWEYYQNGDADSTEIDQLATRNALDDKIYQNQLDAYGLGTEKNSGYQQVKAWVQTQLDGVLGQRGIRNGKDPYTASGNRRSFRQTHDTYTAENLVRAMTRDQQARGQGLWTANARGLEAVASPEYGSVAEMHEDEGRLRVADEVEYQAALTGMDAEIERLTAEILRTGDENPDEYVESEITGDILLQAAQGQRTTAAVQRAFRKEGYNISKTIAEDVLALYQQAAEMPTGYFEAKPERVVGFDEIKAAIVPTTMDQTLRQALEEQGVRVVDYTKGLHARQEAVQYAALLTEAQFSISEDSVGRSLSEGQREYFKDSQIVDADGKLQVLYRGQTGDYTAFQPDYRGAIWTTTYHPYAQNIGENVDELYANVTDPARVTVLNTEADSYDIDAAVMPYRQTNDGVIISFVFDADAAEGTILSDARDYFPDNSAEWMLQNYRDNSFLHAEQDETVAQWWQRVEQDPVMEQHVVVWDSNQLKRVDNLEPTQDQDIRYSIDDGSMGRTQEEKQTILQQLRQYAGGGEEATARLRQYVNGLNRQSSTLNRDGSITLAGGTTTGSSAARTLMETAHSEGLDVETYLRQNWEQYETEDGWNQEARQALALEQRQARRQYSVSDDDMGLTLPTAEDEEQDAASMLTQRAQKELRQTERALTSRLAESLHMPSGAQRAYLGTTARELSNEYLQTGTVSQESLDAAFEAAYGEGLVEIEEDRETYQEIRQYLRETQLQITREESHDIADFEAWRRANFGYLRISTTTGHTNVDTVYQELAALWPEIFDEAEHSTVMDQLQHIAEVTRQAQTRTYTLDQYHGQDAEDFRAWAKNDFVAAVQDQMPTWKQLRESAMEKGTTFPEYVAPERAAETADEGYWDDLFLAEEEAEAERQRQDEAWANQVRENREAREAARQEREASGETRTRWQGSSLTNFQTNTRETQTTKGPTEVSSADEIQELTDAQKAEMYQRLKKMKREVDRTAARNNLSAKDEMQVSRLLRGEITEEMLDSRYDNVKGIQEVYAARAEYEAQARQLRNANRAYKQALRNEADTYLETANEWKDKKMGILYSRETMPRNVLDITDVNDATRAAGKALNARYFNSVQEAEAASTKAKNAYRQRVSDLKLSRKKARGNQISEAAAVQLLGEVQDNVRYLSQHPGVQVRDGRTMNEWQAVIRELWEENPKLDQGKIQKAVKEFRTIYDELFQQMNEVRVRNGYEPVNYRQGYFPHFQENGDGILAHFGRALGISTEVTPLPTSINGMTKFFKPGIQWFGNALSRTGFGTAYDAVEGFDKYIEGVCNVIYHTDNIQSLRALASQIRYRTTDEGIQKQIDAIRADDTLRDEDKENRITKIYESGKYTLSKFVEELEEYTNILAGKKSSHDRSLENQLSRNVYNLTKALESRVAANMVAVNPASWLTNFIPLTQGWGMLGSTDLMTGMWQTLKSIKEDDGLVEMSSFLTNRRGSDALVQTWQQRASATLSKPMDWIDTFTADSLVRGRYHQNLKRGMSETEAMREADNWTAGVMADRSKGSMPTLFERRNPIAKMFTQFQLEVNNQLSYVFKDMPREAADRGKLALAGMIFKFALGAWLYDELYEFFIGRRPALDPLGILNDTVGDLTGYEMPNLVSLGIEAVTGEVTEEDFQTERDLSGAAGNLLNNVADNLPFMGLVSALNLDDSLGLDIDAGRIPIESAIPDFSVLGKAITNPSGWSTEKRIREATDELWKPAAYLALPFGGGQIKKIYQGVQAVLAGGSYTVDADGNDILQYPIYSEDTGELITNAVRASTFGKTTLPSAVDWVNRDFENLSARETAVYQGLLETGMDGDEAFQLIMEMGELTGEESTGSSGGTRKATEMGYYGDDVDAASAYESLTELSETDDDEATITAQMQKRAALAEAEISGDAKSVVYYGLLASEKEQAVMDLAAGMDADMGAVTEALMNIKDAENSAEKRQALEESGLDDTTKSVVYYGMLASDTEKALLDTLAENGTTLEGVADTLMEIKDAENSTGERAALRDADLADGAKTAIYYGLLASDTDKSVMDTLEETGADMDAVTETLLDIKDGDDGQAQREALRDSDLDGDTKSAMYYGLLATDTDKDLMDSLEGTDTDMGAVTDTLMEIRDAESLSGAAKSNAKRDAIANSGLDEDTQIAIYREKISDSRDDDIEAFQEAGLEFSQFLEAHNMYTTINEEYDSASEKATAFAQWVNNQGLTASQETTVKDCFKYYSQVAASSGKYDSFVDAGLSDDDAYGLAEVLRDLEPEDGAESVSSLQKYRAVVDYDGLTEQEQMTALAELMTESEYAKLELGNSYGVTPRAYVTYKETLPDYDADGNGSYNQDEVEAAIDSLYTGELLLSGSKAVSITTTQAAVLWQLANTSWKSKNNPYSVTVGEAVYQALHGE